MDRYADQFMGWLKKLGFTHCFFLAGGGSMHLVDAASKKFECTPVVHEVSAVIAAEYFNESNPNGEKAFALVTTGPGLTNAVTGIAGSWLESRDCLIVGGQVKRADLASGGLRQRGIQEINGVELVKSITKASLRIDSPISRESVESIVGMGSTPRKGPVFIEFCIDASAANSSDEFEHEEHQTRSTEKPTPLQLTSEDLIGLKKLLAASKRPLLLLGAGVEQKRILDLEHKFEELQIPIASTWTGADRMNAEYKYYAGRPNTYGMRWANVFQQQADLLIAIGTRLNLQQTGFNYQEFMPVGKIIQVDVDQFELQKDNPFVELAIEGDANDFLSLLANLIEQSSKVSQRSEWIEFLQIVKSELPIIEDIHFSEKPYINPYEFINSLSAVAKNDDIIVTCSSGGTFTATHQSFSIKKGQKLISNKGLASMGYGLAGAIGACFSNRTSRILLLEGDGGFAQNLQELGTVATNSLNLKMFVVCNDGYASIRSSQKSYFHDNYVGCDIKTGLGLPKWKDICSAYGIKYFHLTSENSFSEDFFELFESTEPVFFEVSTDPNLLYFPKVASKILTNGQMSSAPIHDMTPKLTPIKAEMVFRYLPRELWGI